MSLKQRKKLLRNFTFGIEDSLISTVGVLSGVAIAHQPKAEIIVTGLILISVEAFSMAVGSLLTEQTADEYSARKYISIKSEIPTSLVMFSSYLLSGLVPLSPYIFFPVDLAFKLSIVASLIALICLGVFSGKIARVNPLRSAVIMFLLGGVAVVVGALIGRIF